MFAFEQRREWIRTAGLLAGGAAASAPLALFGKGGPQKNELFHGDGFEKNVDAVARLERALGIYNLAQFTPSV